MTLPSNIAEALERAAREFPERGISVSDSRGRHFERRTYVQVLESAQAVARGLISDGLAPGEPVAVSFPTSWSWLEGWLGVALAGGLPLAVPTPAALRDPTALVELYRHLEEALGCRRILGSTALRDACAGAGCDDVAGRIRPPESWERPSTVALPVTRDDPEATAFLQLTSGSTGKPRAVEVPNRGAMHNPLASDEAIGAPYGQPAHAWADRMVSWVPLYHDMGLIGSLLLPLLTGLEVLILRPEAFLGRPLVWLNAIAESEATFSTAPNFAYQMVVDRVGDSLPADLDLSSWKVALCGAEMVRPETADAFCTGLAGFGFDAAAFRPCYGLAETTLAVTFDCRGQGPRSHSVPGRPEAAEVASNGVPIDATRVRVVSPDGSDLGEDRVGEVQVSGPGVMTGYFRDPQTTSEVLHDGWLATGDLGFLHDGELYLSGRLKEILIVHGHNWMPEEIERVVDGVIGGGGRARSAAIPVAGKEGERAVLVVELAPNQRDRLDELEPAIRSAVGRSLGLPLAEVAFVARGRIPRTTSGKLQRRKLRQDYERGEVERLDT